MEQDEFKESTTVKLDWTIRGVKDLFESTYVASQSQLRGIYTPSVLKC